MARRLSLSLLTCALLVSSLHAVDFTKTPYYTVNPVASLAIDINRDGYVDMIVADDHRFLSIFLGTVGGKFSYSRSIGTDFAPVALASADFDKDGYPDVAVLEKNQWEIFRSDHNGLLEIWWWWQFGDEAMSWAVADFNGDSSPDFLVTIAQYPSSAPPVYRLYGFFSKGVGDFAEQYLGPLTFAAQRGMVVADFNRDGRDDFAIADEREVRVYKVTGAGTRTLLQTLTPSPNADTQLPVELVAGPINGTNGPDLIAVANDFCDGCTQPFSAFIYLNNGNGTFTYKTKVPLGDESQGSTTLVDVTGDNRLDLVHVNKYENPISRYWRSKGDGTFYGPVTISQYVFPFDVASRDLNFDSRHDLMVADYTGPDDVHLNTNAPTICASPNSSKLASKICAPGTTVASGSITVRAAGNSPIGVKRMELWVDGSKKYDSPDDQLRKYISLSSGTHRMTVVAVDKWGATVKTTRYVTVP